MRWKRNLTRRKHSTDALPASTIRTNVSQLRSRVFVTAHSKWNILVSDFSWVGR
jgi:hypothetical protein